MAQRNSEKAREVLTRVIASTFQIRTTKDERDTRHRLQSASGPTGSSRKPQPADSDGKTSNTSRVDINTSIV